nr:unnamed protein product [Spirometra erinaceieuropaei]
MAERPVKPATPTAEKEIVFLKVPSQGDAAIGVLKGRLDQAVSRTFQRQGFKYPYLLTLFYAEKAGRANSFR